MNATLTRIGDVTSSATPVGGVISSCATAVGDFRSSASAVGGITCSMYQVCRSSVQMHYLEISPTVVWILAGHTENDVYSNTFWNVR